MATANLGRVGIVAQGDWSPGTYKYLDFVKHTGGSYLCSALNTTEEPSDTAVDWQVVATDATAEVIDDLTPQLGGFLDTNSFAIQTSKGADIASATATAITDDGNFFDITGTTTIESFTGTSRVGKRFTLQFDGSLTLTHNATSLILPSGANITTSAGDIAEFVEYSSTNYVCVNYVKANGTSLITELVNDTTPQLGGDLDCNGKTFNTSSYRQIADATVSTTATHTFDFNNGDAQQLTIGGDTVTLAFSNFPIGKVATMIIDAVNWGAWTPVYPAGMLFSGGAKPTLTASGRDKLMVVKDKDDVYELFVIGLDVKVV